MSFARTLPLAVILVTPALAQEAERAKHLLRFNFKPDHSWTAVIEQNSKMTMNMGGEDMNTTMDMRMFMNHKIVAVEGNKARIEQEISRVTMKVDNPMMSIDYDSSDPDSDPGMLSQVADMVGSKSKASISDAGKLTDIELAESFEKAAGQGMDMQNLLSQASIELPEKPVAIGETWTIEQKVPMGQLGDTATEVTNKLISVDQNFYVIEQIMKIDTSEMEVPNGMTIDDLTVKGTNKLNRHTGMSEELNMKTKMKMTGPMEMTTEMTMAIKPAPKQVKKSAETPENAPPKTGGGGK